MLTNSREFHIIFYSCISGSSVNAKSDRISLQKRIRATLLVAIPETHAVIQPTGTPSHSDPKSRISTLIVRPQQIWQHSRMIHSPLTLETNVCSRRRGAVETTTTWRNGKARTRTHALTRTEKSRTSVTNMQGWRSGSVGGGKDANKRTDTKHRSDTVNPKSGHLTSEVVTWLAAGQEVTCCQEYLQDKKNKQHNVRTWKVRKTAEWKTTLVFLVFSFFCCYGTCFCHSFWINRGERCTSFI